MRVGVLGGTFNPVHFGHLRAAEEARERLRLDRVLFVVSGNPPLKSESLARATDRYAMVALSVAGNPAFEVSDVELAGEGKSYTVDTLERLRAMMPGAEMFFILGIDAFLDLPNWKEPERLVRAASFAVINRPPHSFSELAASPFLAAGEEALAALDRGGRGPVRVSLKGGGSAFLMNVTALDISASAIRSLLQEGGSVKYLLPEGVESFIMTHGLYAD